MPKTFYTDHDIEDMFYQGVHTLELSDDIVLTDLAFEKARRLGMKLGRTEEKPPAAPVRPYLTCDAKKSPCTSIPQDRDAEDIKARVRAAVISRLGNKVDPILLDSILERVLASVGVK